MLLCVGGGAILGTIFGFFLGMWAPEFCIAIFGGKFTVPQAGAPFMEMNGQRLDIPSYGHRFGLGLGMTNGVWIGLIAGITLVISEAIKSWKKPNP